MPYLGIGFLFILGIIYLAALSQIRNGIEATCFVFSDDAVSRQLDNDGLNVMNTIGVARNETRYGVKYNQTIQFMEIDETVAVLHHAHEIIIKGASKNLFVASRESNLQKTRKGEGA